MCRSSRIPVFLTLAFATPSIAATPAIPSPRGAAAITATAGARSGATRLAQSGDVAAPAVDAGLGLATGLAGAGVPFAPDAAPPYGPPPEPPYGPPPDGPGFVPGPPPCIRSKIIQVGRGLRHPAKTRVIYGAPAC